MPEYVMTGDPIPPEFRTATGINRLVRAIHDMRAILAPLLDHPFISGQDGDSCIWCAAITESGHDADCPVLRKDEILGRAPV